MVTLILAGSMILGAWLTWRRNPLYSARSTVRAAATIALAIAGIIGVVFATANLTIHRSPAIAFPAMAIVVIASSLGLIFLIQAASTPTEAKLTGAVPAGVKLVNIHRRKFYGQLKYFGFALVCLVALSLLIPDPFRYIFVALGILSVVLGAILLPVLYVRARELDVSLTALETKPWIHWQYSPAQWEEWTRARSGEAGTVPEVWFGHDGLFCGGTFTRWLDIDTYLISATIDEQPPRNLDFCFEKVVISPYGSQAVMFHQYVLIPAGSEKDLALLRTNLAARCPKARLHIA